MKTFLLLLLALAFLTGCEESSETPDGKIPASLSTPALNMAGVYHGQWQGRDFSILLGERDSKAVIITRTDLLGEDCHSKIGTLTRVSTFLAKWGNAQLNFSMDPGTCVTASNEQWQLLVTVKYSENPSLQRISLQLLGPKTSISSGWMRKN